MSLPEMPPAVVIDVDGTLTVRRFGGDSPDRSSRRRGTSNSPARVASETRCGVVLRMQRQMVCRAPPEETTVDHLAHARTLDDHTLASTPGPAAAAVREGRTAASHQIRGAVARAYGRSGQDVLTALTSEGTLGAVDHNHGIAWDLGVTADPGVHDLGFYAPDDPRAARPGCLPPGWRQIRYEGSLDDVPVEEYAPHLWRQPRLADTGLMTVYGQPGGVDGRWLTTTAGHDYLWAHGVPAWVQGRSVTVLDTALHAMRPPEEGVVRPSPLRSPRGTDDEERVALVPFVEAARARLTAILEGPPGPAFRNAPEYVRAMAGRDLRRIVRAARASDWAEVARHTPLFTYADGHRMDFVPHLARALDSAARGEHPWVLARHLGGALDWPTFRAPWERAQLVVEMRESRDATARRAELLDRGIAAGMSDRAIAVELGVAHTTVYRRRLALAEEGPR